jgi:Zn-dependent protease/predicted transcriptional regulator
MRASLRIGRIFGIPIKLHVTFLLILPLFALSFGYADIDYFGITLGFGGLPVDDLTKLALGLVAAILFFVAVLLHELAHSYVALKNGYTISGITLMVFGGVSEIENQPPNAPGEAWMAFVGPATSFAIGAVLLPVWFLLDRSAGLGIEIAAVTVGIMSFYNLLLGAFNIIPAFPMDGGRILRSTLAKRVGFLRATTIAAQVGKAFALILGFLGILFLNPWLIFIAFFLYIGAGEEERGTVVSQALEGVSVEQIMTPAVSTVDPDSSVRSLIDKMMTEKHLGYPVMKDNRLLGIVTLQDAQRVPGDKQDSTPVREVMTSQVISVSPATPAMEAIQAVNRNKIGRLVVLDQGRVVGIISRSDLIRILELRQAERGVRARP